MDCRRSNTAILLFTRSACKEATSKKFDHTSSAGNQAIAKQLIAHTKRLATSTGLPVFVEQNQRGRSFGEKLANAIESVFAAGFLNVVAIGNDSPDLTSTEILDAANMLSADNLVLGPATDGGVYLLGITKEVYNRRDFINLPWQTDQLQAAFLRSGALKIKWLTPRCDVDNAYDLVQLMKRLPKLSAIRNKIASILASWFFPAYHYSISHQTKPLLDDRPLRAPPNLPNHI